jgi:ribonuclease J
MRESEDLINDAQGILSKHLNGMMERRTTQWSEIKNEITDVLAPFLYEKTKRRPMILPIIMEI